MNMNKLIDEVKKKIGLVGHLSSVIDDTKIRDIVYMSLEEFNRWSSTELRIPVRYFLTDVPGITMPLYDPSSSPAYLEVPVGDAIGLELAELGSTIKQISLLNMVSTPYMPQGGSMKQDMVFVRRGQAQSSGSARPRIKFKEPNLLIIENFYANMNFYQGYEMVFKVTHPKSLATIFKGLEHWFEELVRRNIEIVLYNNELRFLNVDLGSVRVDLNVDNFANSESNKNDLMETIKERAGADNFLIQY